MDAGRLPRLAVAVMLVLASMTAWQAPASAATGGVITAQELSGVRPLSDEGSFTTITGHRDAAEASSRPFTVTDLGDVVAGGYKTQNICHATDVHVSASVQGFCWASADDSTNVWYPQGITGSGDGANGSVLYTPCSGCAAKKIVAVSWHSSYHHEAGENRLARVSFVDVTNGVVGANYRHVLLVEPDGTSAGYHAIPSHADGIMWYGNKLFMVTGGDPAVSGGDRLVRVFDLRHIWRMSSTSSGSVGCTSSACSAAYHIYALPEIGYYRFAGSGGVCVSLDLSNPCMTSVSLDRSGYPDAMVTTEFKSGGSGGKIMRWPLDADTALLKKSADGYVHPIAGWTSPVWDTQGGVFTGSHGLLAGRCPNGTPVVSYMPSTTDGQVVDSSGTTTYTKSCLHKTTLASDGTLDVHYWTTTPANSQNLSYWPASHELWLASEFKGDGVYPGDRLVLVFDCPGLTCS
ncbi:hypothetical protein [Sphaerisporangium perillae]|uniref:hypothetical protein n=1 Tax=Sphaerisporangium perillae TaxID=2935860 RepID=UPI00200C4FB5|nr:hypothetical protein [Sphaerisporangium perillae]